MRGKEKESMHATAKKDEIGLSSWVSRLGLHEEEVRERKQFNKEKLFGIQILICILESQE